MHRVHERVVRLYSPDQAFRAADLRFSDVIGVKKVGLRRLDI